MARRFTQEELDSLINDYKNGIRPKELAVKYNRDSGTIIGKLQDVGVYVNSFNRLTKDELAEVSNYYINRDWDAIKAKYPSLTKSAVYTLMNKHNIHSKSFYWSEDDVNYLVLHYGKDDVNDIANVLKRSVSSVKSKAQKIGLIIHERWSDEELKILKEYYPIKTVDEMMQLLPKRNRKTIIMKACDLKIKSSIRYSDKDKEYVIAHYKEQTDKEIANVLNRNSGGIMFLRYRLGLFKQTEYSCLNSFKNVFRDCINDWKYRSMEKCSYKCVVTGGEFNHIHHLYSFASICQETFESLNIDLTKPFEEYESDMEQIINEFRQIHNSYPLGVCLSEEVHIEFHKKYGNKNNTPAQWEEFIKSYNR